MTDPLSRESALERCHEAGRKAGKWGSPAEANPYANSDMAEERDAWAKGHSIGAAERVRKP